MTAELFFKWMQHFVSFVRPTPEKKAILILDRHVSHKNLEALQLAEEKSVILFSLPAHCTHRLQPLDVAFFGAQHKYYNRVMTEWMKINPGRPVTIYQIIQLFSTAYVKAATLTIALSGFRATGIAPFNRHIFLEHMFLPSLNTDVPCDENQLEASVPAPQSPI
ncbi:DDE superfamily endonuclease [Popillia japonica]|uniref:DDE superfamily endonuclease n=1 Tax=Popillia japonica TaxID=7064 RepID=A0AAW1K162_POPJA